jgi:hypothetical protein
MDDNPLSDGGSVPSNLLYLRSSVMMSSGTLLSQRLNSQDDLTRRYVPNAVPVSTMTVEWEVLPVTYSVISPTF